MNPDEKWLVAVTAGRWQKHGILEAKVIGLKVLAIDEDPYAEGFADADLTLNISFSDHDAVISALRNLKINICGAVSFCSEVGMTLAAKIREEFNLPGVKLDLCERLLDKAVQRKIWTEKGVPGPEWEVCRDMEEALNVIHQFKLPVIIKPTDSSGSRGVTKIESLNDNLQEIILRAFQFSKSGKVIVESYMDGTEFTVEVFAIDGIIHVLAITEKKKVEGTRGTVARELATPDRPQNVISAIGNTVIAAFKAIDYVDGPGHAEIILMNNGFVGLVEVAGRGGGFMVFNKFVPAVSGVNIARLTALQSVGIPVGQIEKKKKAAVLRFFPSRPGTLTSINGFEESNKIVGVESEPFVQIGDHFDRAIADGDRMGYILSTADTPALAQDLADAAEKMISFEIKVDL